MADKIIVTSTCTMATVLKVTTDLDMTEEDTIVMVTIRVTTEMDIVFMVWCLLGNV